MGMADDLGNLIMSLNPYTNTNFDGTGRRTGGLNIYVGDPTPTDPGLPGTISNAGKIQVEVDTNYPADWSFKGQPQKVNTAIRIPYRYPVYGTAGGGGTVSSSGTVSTGGTTGSPTILYWVTDYMLIGFEGSGSGG